jgi:hypothetical protein
MRRRITWALYQTPNSGYEFFCGMMGTELDRLSKCHLASEILSQFTAYAQRSLVVKGECAFSSKV